MKLILFRHAEATPKYENLDDDHSRELVKKGIERACAGAKILAKRNASYGLLFTSDFVRALQTADILQKQIKVKRRDVTHLLRPEENPQKFLQKFKMELTTVEAAILVGHEPFLGLLASLLVSGGPGGFFHLRKAGWIELEWAIPYKIGNALVSAMEDPRVCR